MKVIKVVMCFVVVHTCSCIKNFDADKCKDRFGANLNENLALFKPTSQTSTRGNAVASRGVDGNSNPYFGNASCSETNAGDNLVWQVNLEEEIFMTSVTITTRADQYWSSSDFFLIYGLLGNTEWKCAEGFFPNTGESISVPCYMPKKSNFVQVRLLKPGGILSLCEVEVHGWKFNQYENEVNYALRQTGRLSSVHATGTAIMALNGDPNFGCMHTLLNPFPSWWSVDLGKIITVKAVTIYSLNGNWAQRIANFDVRIGFAETSDDENYENCVGNILGFGTPETRTIFCTKPIRGRYVTIVSHLDDYFHLCEVYVHGEELECIEPESFGLETFKILDSQINASSFHPSEVYAPQNARLNFRGGSGRNSAWSAKASDPEPWIEVDLLWIVTVTGVLTQGRARSHDQWVTSYSVATKVDGMEFQFYTEKGRKKIFTANSDRNTIVRQNLRPAVVARWFRIYPVTWHGHCSMRMEIIGCQNELYGTSPPRSLGMNNAMILDAQLSASSSDVGWEPKQARLYFDVNGWAAAIPSGSWLQVDFLMVCVIFQIKTQGSAKEPFYVKDYQISHGTHVQSFTSYTENGAVKTFAGNTDQHSIITQTLHPVIVAKIIRIHPISWEVKTALRAEFIGYYRENSIARPLGMEERFITSSQISFSTDYGSHYSQAWLTPGQESGEACWVPHYNEEYPWLQIDFLRLTKVTKIKTQGRPSSSNRHWVVTYYLKFGNNGDFFFTYQRNGKIKMFNGNWDGSSINSQTVSPAIVSRFLRIYPHHTDSANAMRVEFEGNYLGFTESCQTVRALGMEDRRISVHQISASSYQDVNSIPDYGRLNGRKVDGTFGVWIALYQDTNQWYQVDFNTIIKLIEIHTQGQSNQWVKEYTVSYGFHPNLIDYQFYQQNGQTKVFQANSDSDNVVQNTLLPAVIARVIRLHMQSWNEKIAMAVEFVGTYEAPHGPALIDPEYIALENRLTASSFLDLRHRAVHGIISDNVNSTSWTPAVDQEGEYIKVDLLQLTAVSGVGLRTGGDQPNDSYIEVMMQYSDTDGNWKVNKNYREEILTFSTSDCDVQFEKLVVARYVRLVITGWASRTGFVFQLYGSSEYHNAAAGVEDGSIKDSQMKSSNHPNDPHPAHVARLNYRGAWCGNTL